MFAPLRFTQSFLEQSRRAKHRVVEAAPQGEIDAVAGASTPGAEFAGGGSVQLSGIPRSEAGGVSFELSEEVQRKVYELVKARVAQSIGRDANWTITFRSASDSETLFGDTMAEMIAWDVAHQLGAPKVPNRARLAS